MSVVLVSDCKTIEAKALNQWADMQGVSIVPTSGIDQAAAAEIANKYNAILLFDQSGNARRMRHIFLPYRTSVTVVAHTNRYPKDSPWIANTPIGKAIAFIAARRVGLIPQELRWVLHNGRWMLIGPKKQVVVGDLYGEIVLVSAYTHNIYAAYAGKLDGVDAAEFATWRKAEMMKLCDNDVDLYEDEIRQIRQVIESAPGAKINNKSVKILVPGYGNVPCVMHDSCGGALKDCTYAVRFARDYMASLGMSVIWRPGFRPRLQILSLDVEMLSAFAEVPEKVVELIYGQDKYRVADVYCYPRRSLAGFEMFYKSPRR